MWKRKRRTGATVYATPSKCKYTPGDRVLGRRYPKEFAGVFVRSYITVNGKYRNMAWVVKCDIDGKERSFQALRAIV